ncbi:hypothetical protein [Nocardia xishanensis]
MPSNFVLLGDEVAACTGRLAPPLWALRIGDFATPAPAKGSAASSTA